MYNYFTSGKLEKKGEPSFTEGIGFEYKDTFVGLLDKKNLV